MHTDKPEVMDVENSKVSMEGPALVYVPREATLRIRRAVCIANLRTLG